MQVNIGRIEEIVGTDSDMKKVLLGMFLDTCTRVNATLNNSFSLPAADSEKVWKEAVHELKGAAMNLGFEDLADYCKQIEKNELDINKKKEAISILAAATEDVRKLLN